MQYKWFNVYHLKKMHKQSQINEKKRRQLLSILTMLEFGSVLTEETVIATVK